MSRLKSLLTGAASAAAILSLPGAALAQSTSQSPPPPADAAPASTTVEGVTVTGARPDFRASIDRRSYSIANDLQTETGSIADALRNVPSVEVDLDGNVSLRGDSNVTILIDGKPSGMLEGEGRGDVLQQMPADQVDRVEVMTNPSAAFRPDGSAGIINLVTKRSAKPGAFASVRANAGTDGRYSAGVSGSYRAGKLTLSGDLGFRRQEQEGESRSETRATDPDTGDVTESRSASISEGTSQGLNARAGVDYDLDATTRLTAELRHRGMSSSGVSTESYEADDPSGALAFATRREAETDWSRANTEARLGYRKTLPGEGHELSVDLRAERSANDREALALLTPLAPAGPPEFEDIRSATDQDQLQLTADYARPMPGGAMLKLGYDGEISRNAYDNYGARGPALASLAVDPALTNRFLYDQAVHAAYATYQRPFGRLTAQAGLRLERVDIDTDQVTAGLVNSQSYFRAYPTLHLSYELTDAQQLTASYSMRLRRPRANDLNPYPVYVDPFDVRAGNPNLEPQETQSFEIGWQYRAGRTYYLATAYYRDTSKSFTDVVTDLGGGVLLTTPQNLGSSRGAGLELVANGRISRTLSYNVSANLGWTEIDAANLGFTESRSGASLGGRGGLTWQPTDKDMFQVTGFVMGERLQAQGARQPTGMLNLGYRRKVNERLSLVATAQNVLDSFENETVIDTPLLYDRSVSTRRAGRSFNLGFTYRFGETAPRQRDRDPGFDFETPEEG